MTIWNFILQLENKREADGANQQSKAKWKKINFFKLKAIDFRVYKQCKGYRER